MHCLNLKLSNKPQVPFSVVKHGPFLLMRQIFCRANYPDYILPSCGSKDSPLSTGCKGGFELLISIQRSKPIAVRLPDGIRQFD